MADDVNAALRAELNAALAVLDPQIRGLDDLKVVSISDALRGAVTTEASNRRRRQGLIQAVLDALDATNAAIEALNADGYPALPDVELPPDLFSELQGENSDIDAAIDVFASPTPATTLLVELGEPTDKTDLSATKRK